MTFIAQFYGAVATGAGALAANLLAETTSLNVATIDALTPFGEALDIIQPEYGQQFLWHLKIGKKALTAQRDEALRKAHQELGIIVTESPWLQLLEISHLIKMSQKTPTLFRRTPPEILETVQPIVDEKITHDSGEALPFYWAKEAIESVLGQGRKIAILTGAGISADSGVPIFRGANAMRWNGKNPWEIANLQTLAEQPQEVWNFYQWRREQMEGIKPNSGHLALARMEALYGDQVTLITQNVDGLHQKAGSHKALEIHGTLWETRCMNEDRCDNRVRFQKYDSSLATKCAACGSWMRSSVVMFGDEMPQEPWKETVAALRGAHLFLVIGTSGSVDPANQLISAAHQLEEYVVQVNLEPTEESRRAHAFIAGRAGDVLPALLPRFRYPEEKT